ncbi:MAG: hypothetical protein MUC92_03515 [Fimbriimonadaceae bacterium]|nr:hypothetical protein [Fimbriimonadaceae bacterium]
MGFEPLKTDEKIPPTNKPKSDFEAQLMSGCSVIVVVAFLTYFLTAWPWFVFPLYTLTGLQTAIVAGCGTSVVLGGISCFRFRIAGASGFLGGALAAGVFIFLVLNEVGKGRVSQDLPRPEYPERWQWMVPLLFVVACVLVAILLTRKEKTESLAAN